LLFTTELFPCAAQRNTGHPVSLCAARPLGERLMFRALLLAMLRDRRPHPSARRPSRPPFAPRVEGLENRLTPAVTAVFSPGTGILTVVGDGLNNTITVSRDAAGGILVNGGAAVVKVHLHRFLGNGPTPVVGNGGTPTVADVNQVRVFGRGGDDTITLDESNGALPRAVLFGGAGNDVLTGGSGDDQLFGQAGNDTLLGKDGFDLLFGGAGNDVLTGDAGNDTLRGGAGDDVLIGGLGLDVLDGGPGDNILL
jgi:Ca2+-binding RTX toxin-like protein